MREMLVSEVVTLFKPLQPTLALDTTLTLLPTSPPPHTTQDEHMPPDVQAAAARVSRKRCCVSTAKSPTMTPPLPCFLLFLLLLLLLPGLLAEDFSPISPLTRFDAKGQLPQSDAAARAVARGGPLIALSLKEAVLLVAPR